MPRASYKSVIARLIATAIGAGYSPVAPGTCGTALAVPLAWALADLTLWSFIGFTCATTLLGIWAATVADRHWGTHDSGRIVIDEVAGYLVTVMFVSRADWVLLLMGFVLFRFFDIVKPAPVRWLDHNLPGGMGVVIDDIAAGIYACAALFGLSRTPLPEWIHSWAGA